MVVVSNIFLWLYVARVDYTLIYVYMILFVMDVLKTKEILPNFSKKYYFFMFNVCGTIPSAYLAWGVIVPNRAGFRSLV
jgi:hypothetical protein